MESALHLDLKRCAEAWIRAAGARGVAHEVRTAIPFWRADVAAWLENGLVRLDGVESLPRARVERLLERDARDTAPALFAPDAPDALADLLLRAGAVDLFGNPDWVPGPSVVRRLMATVSTVIVECKASRADFASDRLDLHAADANHDRLLRRRDRLREALVARWEPHLRREGETLFRETDGWEFGRSRLSSVRQADRDERLAREALESRVKFARLARWKLADRLYLCTPGGLLKLHEVPQHWGWIEVTRGAVRLRKIATDLSSPPARRWRTVRSVHRAGRAP